MLLHALMQGILLGLGAAVPIGPVNVELARRTLRGGFRSGVALGCGAVTVDIFYAGLTSLSLRPLLIRPAIQVPLAIAGIALLLYLAAMCFISAAKAVRTADSPLDGAPISPESLKRNYITGLLMTLLNPMTLAFWFVVVPATVTQIGTGNGSRLAVICAGVFIGTLSWVLTFAGLLYWLGRSRRNWWILAADTLGGLILASFALAAIWTMLRAHEAT